MTTQLFGGFTFDGTGGGSFDSTGGPIVVLASTGKLNTDNSPQVVTGSITLNGTMNHLSGTFAAGYIDGTGTIASIAELSALHYPRRGNERQPSARFSVAASGSQNSTSRVGTIEMVGSGHLDLADNDLLVTVTPEIQVRGLIGQARHQGAWDLPGIMSSAARTQPAHATTLGVLRGADYRAVNGTEFDGFLVANTDTVVKYTWYGDTDLNGRVNFDDYVRTDNGFNNQLKRLVERRLRLQRPCHLRRLRADRFGLQHAERHAPTRAVIPRWERPQRRRHE